MADFGREPDPKWTDLDDKDKIERLSAVISSQNISLYQITKYLELLVDHDHMGGQIVQPIDKQFLLQNRRFFCDDLPKNWLD